MGRNILSNIRDDTQNGSAVETVAAEAGKDKNNKEGEDSILFMKRFSSTIYSSIRWNRNYSLYKFQSSYIYRSWYIYSN